MPPEVAPAIHLREQIGEFLRVDRLAQAKELPDASITDGVLKITPLDNQESDEAELLTRQAYGLMPRIKISA